LNYRVGGTAGYARCNSGLCTL